MTLFLEYIMRNSLLKNLINFPSTLALVKNEYTFLSPEDTRDRIWLILRDSDENVIIENWEITKLRDNFPICNCVQTLPKSMLFKPYSFYSKDFKPIKFIEEPVSFEQNEYNKPMPKDIYESFWNKMLCPPAHNQYKECFLWDSFIRSKRYNLGLMYSATKMPYHLIQSATDDMIYIRSERKDIWETWETWTNILLKPETVSNELIFSKGIK